MPSGSFPARRFLIISSRTSSIFALYPWKEYNIQVDHDSATSLEGTLKDCSMHARQEACSSTHQRSCLGCIVNDVARHYLVEDTCQCFSDVAAAFHDLSRCHALQVCLQSAT